MKTLIFILLFSVPVNAQERIYPLIDPGEPFISSDEEGLSWFSFYQEIFVHTSDTRESQDYRERGNGYFNPTTRKVLNPQEVAEMYQKTFGLFEEETLRLIELGEFSVWRYALISRIDFEVDVRIQIGHRLRRKTAEGFNSEIFRNMENFIKHNFRGR